MKGPHTTTNTFDVIIMCGVFTWSTGRVLPPLVKLILKDDMIITSSFGDQDLGMPGGE